MKKMMWILTVLLVPSLSSAQSRGDMLPFQGPAGAMATLATPSKEPAASKQSVQDQKLSNLSDEGAAFKQVIDGFKSGIGLQLTNESQRDNAEVAQQVMSALEQDGILAKAFASYLTIQHNKMALMQQAVEAASKIDETVAPKDISGGNYLGSLINRRIEENKAKSHKRRMLEERHTLLAYLNEAGDITLADYLSAHLGDAADRARIDEWINELNAAN